MNISKYIALVKVTKQNPATARLVRESFIKPFNIDTKTQSFHHIIPVSLGGQNNRGNLVVMDKRQHDALHRNYINPQIEDMKIGDTRIIMLPQNYDMKSDDFKMFHKLYMEMMIRDYNRKRKLNRAKTNGR